MKKYIKVFALVFLTVITTMASASEKSTELENKLKSVSNLLDRSALSKQVLDSHSDAAVQYYRFAKSLYDEAVDAYNAGNFQKTNALIKKSRAALVDAVEFANLKGAKVKKRSKNHYESLRKSANALMEAMERIGDEKGKHDELAFMLKGLAQKLAETDKLFFQGQYDSAITGLGKVLKIIKVEIANMRTGDTLTRSLKFANAHEEYDYEVDRNDTHMMLLEMYISQADDNFSLSMKDGIKTAKELRKDAEQLADAHKYKDAINIMEKSTIEIISLIRSTGTFIP
ncbi:MAG: hypothetical protein OQK32_04935 [Gammaproteobacteria bacterium]|nr:hypothetical protein [Gammaproteobacteria bacterium]MCW8922496.1 hypothetical protein [Gammaproteobacteria bacterium]